MQGLAAAGRGSGRALGARGTAERAVRLATWAALVLALPLPLLGLQSGVVPAGRMWMLGGLCVAVMALETTRGVVPILAAMFLGQALLWTAGLWVLAGGLARAARWRAPVARRVVLASAFVAIALALVAASQVAVYRTPYAAAWAHATLLEVYR